MGQTTSNILMIRPFAFGFNAETADNNVFQHLPGVNSSDDDVAGQAKTEFDRFVRVLRQEGVTVHVVEDSAEPLKPDAIFPNNWVSFHDDGSVVTYPMYSKARRKERREEIIDRLSNAFDVQDWIHLEGIEAEERFLEGTGSLVLDRVHKIAYACISERTDPMLFSDWCKRFGYEGILFNAISNGLPIYHTNVMMALGSQIAIVCLECIPDQGERDILKQSLSRHHEIVEISQSQLQAFAGNMLALKNNQNEELMVMSEQAYKSLNAGQKQKIEKYCRIVSSPLDTIESIGGGSARCMIAEIFLNPK